jgi:hypothetical protein
LVFPIANPDFQVDNRDSPLADPDLPAANRINNSPNIGITSPEIAAL